MKNEKKYFILLSVLFFIFGAILTGSIEYCIYKSRIRQADRRIEELTAGLAVTSEQLTRAENLINRCSIGIDELSGKLASDTGKLADIIRNLEIIRDEVEVLENCISEYNSSICSNNYNVTDIK